MNINSETVWKLKRLIFFMYVAISWNKEAKTYKYALLEMVYIVFL